MSNITTALITVVILIVVFLILREVICWYWKINETIDLQKEQNSILQEILTSLKSNSIVENVTSNQITKEPEIKLSDEELMIEYNITLQDDMYVYKTYKYKRLIDAVNYAKQSDKRKSNS